MASLLLFLSHCIRVPFLMRASLMRWLYRKPNYVIAINMAGCGPLTGGVGNYTELLLRGWTRYVPWNSLILYCTWHNFQLVRQLPLSCRLKHSYLHREEDLLSLEKNWDLLFCPFGKVAPVPPPHPIAFHFADIQDYFFPEFFSLTDLSSRRNNYRNARAFADHMLVPSEFSKRSIMACLQLPEERISVVPLPVADLPRRGTLPLKLKSQNTPFIYYPADNYVHKNHKRLFLAISELKNKGWNGRLICTGGRVSQGVNLDILAREIGIESHFIDLGKVSRREVSWLYRHAELLIFPSLFEGYGLPVIAAFDAGLPAICSGVTSLPELGGEAVLYCNPFDFHDIAEKIETLWNNKELRSSLSAHGKERRKLFSTKRIVQQHLEIFSKVIQEARAGNIVEPLKSSLPEMDLKLTESLYREGACDTIRDFIPPRDKWFLSGEVAGIKDHGTSFSIQNPPQASKQSNLMKRELLDESHLLPVHFFTIVYNGMPFIEKHLEIFQQLPFEWHWHIVEGVAELVGDTAWSLENGAKLPEEVDVLSDDGTTEYLDRIAQQYPEQITLYRKNRRWHGKAEMISAPIANLPMETLLWEVDVDEIWTADQIIILANQFLKEPTRSAARFYCRFFVGPDRIADNLGSYGNNPSQEWRRVWRYQTGDYWERHEPPCLMRKIENGTIQNVMEINPFTQEETWRMGLVFDHFAFATEKQLSFKENYYGYSGAAEAFRKMCRDEAPEILVKKYYSWVKDPIWAFKA